MINNQGYPTSTHLTNMGIKTITYSTTLREGPKITHVFFKVLSHSQQDFTLFIISVLSLYNVFTARVYLFQNAKRL